MKRYTILLACLVGGCLQAAPRLSSSEASGFPITSNTESHLTLQNSDAETGIRLYQQERYETALPYLQRAAKAGNLQVLSYLGYMFQKGLGTAKDFTAAYNMYKRGSDKGDTRCMALLGQLYLTGEGVKANPTLAVNLLQKAAGQKDPQAANLLCMAYRKGKGVKKDITLAVKYAVQALEQGDTTMAEWLGLVYFKGSNDVFDAFFGNNVQQNHAWALAYWTIPGAKYSQPVRLLTALMLKEGQGTTDTVKDYPCHYKQRIHGQGVDGKTYLAEALTIADQLVEEGYEDARSYQRTWKAEYNERIAAANKVTAPRWTEEIVGYLTSYRVPREMAYCGGQTRYRAIIDSNGQVTNIRTVMCSVAAKEQFDKTFLANLPRFVPGTKGGEPVDMEVVFWLDWVPKRNLKMAECHVYNSRNQQLRNKLFE